MHVLFNDGRIILKLIVRICMGWINSARYRDSAGLFLSRQRQDPVTCFSFLDWPVRFYLFWLCRLGPTLRMETESSLRNADLNKSRTVGNFWELKKNINFYPSKKVRTFE
jgi:hypothetical protein